MFPRAPMLLYCKMQWPFINPADWSAAQEDVYSLKAWLHVHVGTPASMHTCVLLWVLCHLHVCVCVCVYCVKHWRLRNSNPSTSVWVFVWLECLGRSLASISSDRLDLPVIPVFLTISLCINSHIHRCTRGWQACDLPQHQSLPARSAGAASTGNHTQDSIIGYWTISALVLSAFPLLSSGSRFYHLSSEIKFVFPEMRKLSQTCRMIGRFAVLVYSHFSLYIH